MVIIAGDNKVIIDVFLLSIITCFLIDNTINLLIISGKSTVLKPLPIYVKNSLLGMDVRCLCHILLPVCRLY